MSPIGVLGFTMLFISASIGFGWFLSWTLDKDWAGKFWAAFFTVFTLIGIVLVGVSVV